MLINLYTDPQLWFVLFRKMELKVSKNCKKEMQDSIYNLL